MKKIISLVVFYFFYSSITQAQFTRYLIQFRYKGASPFTLSNPLTYLSQAAIDRRSRYQLAIDSTDLPVNPNFLSQIAAVPNVTILNASRWLNQVSIQTSDPSAIDVINTFSFVRVVTGIAARMSSVMVPKRLEDEVTPSPVSNARINQNPAGDYYDYGAGSLSEMQVHHGDFLHNIGLRGEGMRTALIDAGFYHYNVLKAFDSININGQVADTWDFVAREASVAEDNSHGMSCLSTMSANLPGQFVGTAPKTHFYLYRTEDVASEYPIEEHNWVCGAERADSSGADVISSSLGYTTFDNAALSHVYGDMDGNTTMAARGADMAAKKGLLIFIAAGNEGGNAWHYIMTPADADSVIAVGAIATDGIKGGFSSFGPSADGRVKPDLVSVGVRAVIETLYDAPGISQGTSYACPKLAGLGTCLWQGFPEFNNMRIVRALKESANNFQHPTDSLGYGVPDMKIAFNSLLTDYATSDGTIKNCNAVLQWNSKDVGAMKYEVERKASGETDFTRIGEWSPVAGTILTPHSYEMKDSLLNVSTGALSYRIKQITDTSAAGYSFAYIDTISLMNGSACGSGTVVTNNNAVSVAPNPVHDDVNLILQSATALSLSIRLYDITGRLLFSTSITKTPGKITYIIHTDGFPAGRYQVVVYNGKEKFGSVGIVKL